MKDLFKKVQAYAARKFKRVSTRENLNSALVLAVFLALIFITRISLVNI
jgi:hypothetical protein